MAAIFPLCSGSCVNDGRTSVKRLLYPPCWPRTPGEWFHSSPSHPAGRRNRKSIKTPMNQHSQPASLGRCATLLDAPPLHCLCTSFNPMSGSERSKNRGGSIGFTQQCFFLEAVLKMSLYRFSFSLPFPMSEQIRAEERFTCAAW